MSIKLGWIVAGFAVILLMGFVGESDYRAELSAENAYYQNVCDGVWPDYKNRKPACE